MKILFLDQSGELGGAELFLADLAGYYQDSCLVGLFADGSFSQLLAEKKIPHQVLTQKTIGVKKDSGLGKILSSIFVLIPLIFTVAKLARQYDLIYANTQKALVVGALASIFARKPLIYHLHDILSPEHFSKINRAIALFLANHFTSLIIANSHATQTAFLEAGGKKELITVVYNGFNLQHYQISPEVIRHTRESLGVSNDQFVIGHFSRLSPWKGQHILLQALSQCPDNFIALLIGDALFGENDYVTSLHQQVKTLGLENRVKFLGFRGDIPPLMSACDVVVHTSTAPEPLGRVVIEAMLCGTPVVGSASGGVLELIEDGKTGWLCTPADSQELSAIMINLRNNPTQTKSVSDQGLIFAQKTFSIEEINQKINYLSLKCQKRTPC